MLGIGIIGAGTFAEHHARAIIETQDVELMAASRRNTEELQKFSGKFNIAGYTDYEELLKNQEINAVVIAVPHQEHTRVAVDAARAGKHILLEKPMATSIEGCMQFMRSSSIVKEIIDSGEFGEIIYGTGIVAKEWLTPNRKSWHRDDPVGGGILITMGIHYIDLLTWWFNSRVSSVRASISNRIHKDRADDSGMILLQYDNGANGTVINTGYEQGAEKFTATLICEKGMLQSEMFGGVHIGKNNKWNYIPDSASPDTEHEALLNEWETFAGAIKTNTSPQVTGEYGKHIMEIVFAARESSAQNKEIWI
jgi:predicted dehydrogenase